MTDMEKLNTTYTDVIEKYNRLRAIMLNYAERMYGNIDTFDIVLDNGIYGCGSTSTGRSFKFTLEDVYKDTTKTVEGLMGWRILL